MKPIQLAILTMTGAIITTLGLVPRLARLLARPLRAGDWIRIAGGYETEPKWLGGRDYVDAQVIAFIDSLTRGRAAVVQLREVLPASPLQSDVAVLFLRYKGALWKASGIVHVELWQHSPSEEEIDGASDPDREWVESHANYRVVR